MSAVDRPQTLGEEIANSVSHGVAFVLAVATAPFLIGACLERGAAIIAGVSIFAATAILLYLFSTLYHALPVNRAKNVFQVLDHAAIFLLIAGTYTPFTLSVLRGGWGWALFGVIWGLAIIGVLRTSLGGKQRPVLATCIYIAMGWLMIIAVRPLYLRMPLPGLLWLMAGGVAYTAGAACLAAERLHYAHFIFHLFVMVGTACHVVAVWNYAVRFY